MVVSAMLCVKGIILTTGTWYGQMLTGQEADTLGAYTWPDPQPWWML